MMRPMAGARQTTGMPIGAAGGTPTEVAGTAGVDVLAIAERLRDLPGLAVLDSARGGRRSRWTYVTADPVAVVTDVGPPGATFGPARALLARMGGPARVDTPVRTGGPGVEAARPRGAARRRPDARTAPVHRRPRRLRRLRRRPRAGAAPVGRHRRPAPPAALPRAPRLGDRRGPAQGGVSCSAGARWTATGRVSRRASRRCTSDSRPGIPGGGTVGARDPRRDRRARRLRGPGASGSPRGWAATPGSSGSSASVRRSPPASCTRRTSRGAWRPRSPATRGRSSGALRTGDLATFAAYLDLGRASRRRTRRRGPVRGIVSASPEPFLAVDAHGRVATDPIKGTRPRGRDPRRGPRARCRAARERKDRAEHVMIVDVLRNDLGRVCRPGSVRVPALCRLERPPCTTWCRVVGRCAPGRGAVRLLAAAFPGGSITGAPKVRAMQMIEELEPVRRGPYCGALWLGPDGALGSSILIRTLVADGHRLTLHVGGGITRRSDPVAEWEETRAKARGPLRAIEAVDDG